jgi:hypothetical protein
MTDQPFGRGKAGEESTGSSPTLLHRPDIIVSVIILTVCALLFARTFWFDTVPDSLAQNVQPHMFPRLVLVCIAAIALLLPFEYARKKARDIDLDSDRRDFCQLVADCGWVATDVGREALEVFSPLCRNFPDRGDVALFGRA